MLVSCATPRRLRWTPKATGVRRTTRPRLAPLRLRPRLHPIRCSEKSVATKLQIQDRAKNTALWDTLDVVSVTGTVGGAVLVALGFDLSFAALPIALPILSLFVGIRRERQRAAARDVFDELLTEDIANQRAALADVQAEMASMSAKIESLLNGKLRTFEEKLDRIEGTLVSTSKNVRQVSGGLRSLPGIMKRISDLQQRTVIYAVSSEFRSLFEQWGSTQLKSIGEVTNRLKFLEDSVERLRSSHFISSGPGIYNPSKPSTIDVTAERHEAKSSSAALLSSMRDVIGKELTSVLKQLKENQVDMMQSLRDVRMNPIPQADYSFLENQLEKIEDVLGDLPKQLSDTFKSEAPTETLKLFKEAYSKQFSAISAVVKNLERAIQDLKGAAGVKGDGQKSLELDVLEQKWLELRSLMHALSDQIAGVNERMENIMQQSEEQSLEFEGDNEEEMQPVVEEETEPMTQEYLEFPETTEPVVPTAPIPSNGAADVPLDSSEPEPEWDVVSSLEDSLYSQPRDAPEEDGRFEEELQSDPETDPHSSLSGDPRREGQDNLDAISAPQTTTNAVRTVGNAKTGLELLKKGRLALEEVPPVPPIPVNKEGFQDYGEASRCLVMALQQFESILEVDPVNIQCLGNCGNTMLALGELKLRMAGEIPSSEDDLSSSAESALEQLQEEAQQFLTLAGRQFKKLLENKPNDKRAYMNWGKALCMRAQLTEEPALKMQLYDAAIVKYDQILTFAPNFPEALFFGGVASKESSQVQTGTPMSSRDRLNKAVAYFQAVGRAAPSSPLQFEAFQMIQECQQLAGSPTLI